MNDRAARFEKYRPKGISPGRTLTTTREVPTMFWLVVFAVPVCIELAGWVVDTTFMVRLLNERQVCQVDDRE